jgi:hypothetical protein
MTPDKAARRGEALADVVTALLVAVALLALALEYFDILNP